MDSCETIVKNDTEADKQISPSKIENNKPNVSNFFSTIWLRRPICVNNEVDRFLLDYGFNFLFYIGSFLWLLFLIFS
jgi:hypothetical protein